MGFFIPIRMGKWWSQVEAAVAAAGTAAARKEVRPNQSDEVISLGLVGEAQIFAFFCFTFSKIKVVIHKALYWRYSKSLSLSDFQGSTKPRVAEEGFWKTTPRVSTFDRIFFPGFSMLWYHRHISNSPKVEQLLQATASGCFSCYMFRSSVFQHARSWHATFDFQP